MQKSSSKEYDDIISRSNQIRKQAKKLEKEKREKQNEKDSKLPYKTYLTGIINGKIIDLDINEYSIYNTVELKIRLENNENIVVNVNDNKKYEEKNELIRLLYMNNITEYKIDNLLGRKIKLISDSPIYTRNKSSDEINWSVYIPSRLDRVSKISHKINYIYKFSGDQYTHLEVKNNNLYTYFFLSFITYLIVLLLVMIAFYPFVTADNDVEMLKMAFITSFGIVSISPILIRLGGTIIKKYNAYKNEDTLKK